MPAVKRVCVKAGTPSPSPLRPVASAPSQQRRLWNRLRPNRRAAASHRCASVAPFLRAGSQTMQGEAVGFETEATAIMDTMAYIRPDIYTLASGRLPELLRAPAVCWRGLH